MIDQIKKNRIVGERVGSENGPLLIILTQIHGNEPAGLVAVKELFNAIDRERIEKPNFKFCGRILALHGNKKAVENNARYIQEDLNRCWTKEKVDQIMSQDPATLQDEAFEQFEILTLIHHYISNTKPTRVLLLDIHTTTAHGGIFTIPAPTTEARRIALTMHAPVLHDFLKGLKGTTLHYFCIENFPGIDITGICFEAGQHNCKDSPKHAISAIINCFAAIGGFYEEDIESKHDILLLQQSNGLPLEAKLVYVHPINPDDDFNMLDYPIYKNFAPIKKGEIIANDKNGPIASPASGLILMPLYQKQGEDGFFIIKEITPRSVQISADNTLEKIIP